MSLYNGEFFRNIQRGSFDSAAVVVPEVLSALRGIESVVDVGCGTGTWLRRFQEHGVHRILGIDGNYVDHRMLLFDQVFFEACELKNPFAKGRKFDLSVSLEVAEHLPPEHGPAFIAELVSLAPCVLFSAAIPGQGGTGHLNQQWPSYWAGLFHHHGYTPYDFLRPRIWDHSGVEWWYCQNMILFAKRGSISGLDEQLRPVSPGEFHTLDVVHPRCYIKKVQLLHSLIRTLQEGQSAPKSVAG